MSFCEASQKSLDKHEKKFGIKFFFFFFFFFFFLFLAVDFNIHSTLRHAEMHWNRAYDNGEYSISDSRKNVAMQMMRSSSIMGWRWVCPDSAAPVRSSVWREQSRFIFT
jgi:hypothetical protein